MSQKGLPSSLCLPVLLVPATHRLGLTLWCLEDIDKLDRAVSASMAKGSFGTRTPAPGPMTADQLWSLENDAVPPMPNGERLWSMSSRPSVGPVSVSSRGRDSGYSEHQPAPSRRQKSHMSEPYSQSPYEYYAPHEYEQYQPYPTQQPGYYSEQHPQAYMWPDAPGNRDYGELSDNHL